MKRCFFGLKVSEKDRQSIAVWRNKHLANRFKAVAAENFHLTLAFLGNVDEQQLHQLMATAHTIECPKITINLTELGFWHKPKVLYLTSNSCPAELKKLANTCTNAAVATGISITERHYIPHLTLARKAKYLPSITTPIDFTLNFAEFCLFQSLSTESGVKYQALKSWTLSSKV
ncbi:RNA 2',3'-cyclic phosphodiesterase [Thalassotalea sp. ND16A]|uniref:RNA 2',3'-cyclic phosphodiesterase n=1 Tax=Thalassotalea sp. ND16A TaxID=1535422 RepID=UPI00051D0830|nr:RNA 2',3'-cyclic phosphodiesterase [Thalassotalea sp. ND16A]KGJ99217.1 hypothetical protein ND16A_0367 [Thalassotalea sp. ND16A]